MGDLAKKQIIPSSSGEARIVGSLIYFTGKPCPKGHIANRYTSSHCCVECKKSKEAKSRNKVWYKENGDLRNQRKRAAWKKNKPIVAMQQRKWREKNPRRAMFISAKSRAKAAGWEFNLKLSDIVIPDVCPVLGIKLKAGKEYSRTNSPSLDRIDNSKGYIRGNIAVISVRANIIKRDASLDELESIVAYMRLHEQK